MNKLLLALTLVAVAPATAATSAAQSPTRSKPNFIIVFIDDMGYGDIGPFGATKQKTPNLDRVAREGVRLTSFYAAPVCSVSRAQLLTGCYGARVSVPGVYGPGSANGLNPSEQTIAEHLKQLGYATACVGKWHVGDQPQFLPTKQGFDRYFGIPYSNDMQRRRAQGGETVVPLLRNDQVIELLSDTDQTNIVQRYTEEAISFIRDSKDRPFFLYLPHTAVHTPIHPGPSFAGTSQNGRFGDWVQEVDWSIGRLLETLQELDLDPNTLLFFTSDNGPWLIKGPDGGSAGPLRGGKGSTWEGGVRVPTLARWPGSIPPATTCDAVAGTIDLLPTFVTLAGGSVSNQPVIDGRDISPLLFGKSARSPREAHYYFAGYNLQAVRQGQWKLAIATQPQTMGRSPSPDATINPRLYNLDQEIGEQTNLSDKHPDIVAKLQSLADKMNAEIGGSSPAARRPPGTVQNPQTLYPTQPALGRKAKKPPGKAASTTPADLASLKPGDTLSANAAPQVANRPFTFSCLIEPIADSALNSLVILSHGGSAIGYALYLQNDEIVFAVRQAASQAAVRATAPPSKPVPIIASLLADGTLQLKLDGQPPVTAKGPGLLSRQPSEEFCIGLDSARPAVSYENTVTPFEGHITQLKFTSP